MKIREQIQRAKSSELLTVEQVALLAQYHPQTIYRKAKRGEIPGLIRYGGGIRFRRAEVLAWQETTREARDLRSI